MNTLKSSLYITVIFLILCGFIFPFALTMVGRVCFPTQANGSLIYQNSTLVGSKLIGQDYSGNLKYFQSRKNSGSGVDPEIFISDANQQAIALSKSTGISLATLNTIIKSNTIKPQFGVLGPERVNVLMANLELQKMYR
ncbi:MAG: potassium-transporting ATPase subunit C [Fusobacteria bacterium]|nr:potassium-transporting ATPase subunit C [Fusobacteriota bacterium]